MAKVYLDSCVIIYLIQGPDSLSQTIRDALQPDSGSRPMVCVSDLTRLECRVWPIKQQDQALLQQFDALFASQDIELLPLDTEAFDLATELRAEFGTKTPDALHLAAALLGGCTEFWTNDHRLNAATAGKIDLRIFSG